MEFKVGFGTDVGLKRTQNQDSGGSFPDIGLFLVADGMGGHQGGETASKMAVETIAEFVREKKDAPGWNNRTILTEAIRKANTQIHEKAKDEPDLQGMGTTTTALLFSKEGLSIGHVGDSRCYFVRPKAIWQLTRDHSLVQEKLKAGLITREQMRTDRLKNVITRSVGFESEVNVEIYEMDYSRGDIFLICSDGLSGMVEEPSILSQVHQDFIISENPQMAVRHLIEKANEQGGEDNITVVLFQVNGDSAARRSAEAT